MTGATLTPDRAGELRLGDRLVRVEPFSGRKALAAFRLLKTAAHGAPEVFTMWADFTRRYEAENSIELTRAAALFEFPPRRNEAGEIVAPGRFGHLTDADWQASGNVVRLPKSPTLAEQIAAVFPVAFDLAEREVLRLLALVAMPEDDVKANRGDLDQALDQLADEILDAPFDALLELAVVGGEAVDDQYRRKVDNLGDRLGNALRLLGIDRAKKPPQPAPSTSRPTSSTDSPAPTDGRPTSPSELTGASSSASSSASTTT